MVAAQVEAGNVLPTDCRVRRGRTQHRIVVRSRAQIGETAISEPYGSETEAMTRLGQ